MDVNWQARAEAAEARLSEVQQGGNDFASGVISSGKLAEILNVQDKHTFKQHAGAFDEDQRQRLSEVTAELSRVKEQRDNALTELTETRTTLTAVRGELSEVEVKRDRLKIGNDRLQSANHRLSRDIATLRTDQERLTARCKQLEAWCEGDCHVCHHRPDLSGLCSRCGAGCPQCLVKEVKAELERIREALTRQETTP